MSDLFLLDSNIILRVLIEDDKVQLNKIKKLLHSDKNFYLHDVIVSEVIWVAVKFYKVDKETVINAITNLIELPNLFCDKDRILEALNIWNSSTKLSFVDSYLLASSSIDKNDAVYTFDKGILKTKVNGVNVLEPA